MSSVDLLSPALAPTVALVATAAIWLIPLLLVLSAIKILLLPKLRGMAGEAQVAAVLDRLGTDVLHDIVLPDDRGGLTQVDHVVLTAAALLVVETKNYRGSILGQEREAQWTQRLGDKCFRFQNPLRQNYAHTQAIQALAPRVPVLGWVVFTDAARFPKGMPEGVSSLRNLRRDLAERIETGPPSPALLSAWESLKAKADRSTATRKAHLDGLRARLGPDRQRLAGWVQLALASVWLVGVSVWNGTGLGGRSPHEAGRAEIHASVRVTAPAPTPRPAIDATPAESPSEIPGPAWPVSDRGIPAADLPSAVAPPIGAELAPGLHASAVATRGPDCNSAIAAVLVDNSATNRSLRDRACGEPAAVQAGQR